MRQFNRMTPGKVVILGAIALSGLTLVVPAAGATAMAAAETACPLRDLSAPPRGHSAFNYAGNDCGDIWRLVDEAPFLKNYGVTFDGWLDGGIMGNAAHPGTRFNGPVGFADKDNGQFNQGYLSLARTAPKDNQGWFLGGRVDEFYGSDFDFATAAALDGARRGNLPRWHNSDFTYGRALTQLYVEGDYNDLQVKAGHFYTILGHESVMAKNNFFYTHSYAFMYGEPTTDSGVLVSKPLNANWALTGGLVDGWNQFSANSTQGERNFNNFLGGASYADKRFGAALTLQAGNDSDFNIPGIVPYSRRTLVDFVGTANITPRLNYLVEALDGAQSQSLGFNANNAAEARWYGVNQQLLYAFNDKWSLGARAEWFDDPQGYLVTGLRPGGPTTVGNTDARFRFPGSFYDASAGVNYKPLANLTLRGEIREDWYTGSGGFVAPAVPGAPPNQPFDDNARKNQFLFGLDAVLQF